jgi:hypothetical protein
MHILRPMPKPLPADHRNRFKVGQLVRLARPEFMNMIPVGAMGEILRLEDPDTFLAQKGRDYVVEFNLTEYNIVIPVETQEMMAEYGIYLPPVIGLVRTNLSVNDLEAFQ